MFLELHDTILSHRKIRKLSRELKISQVETRGHLVTLWLHVLQQAPDGDLSGWDSDDLAHYAEWDGDPASFIDACVGNRLLDSENGIYSIHNWERYTHYLMTAKRRRGDRERKRRQRERERQSRENENSSRVTDVTVTRDVRDTSVTSRVQPEPEPEPEPEPKEAMSFSASAENDAGGAARQNAPRKRSPGSSSPRKRGPRQQVIYSELETRMLARYRERSGRSVRTLSARAQRQIAELTSRGAVEQDLADAIDGMLAEPHRGDNGKVYREIHHAWTDALFESHRERGETMRQGGVVDPTGWEAMRAKYLGPRSGKHASGDGPR